MNRRFVGLLAGSHLLTDVNQGVLPALLPFLITTHHLSYAAAAGLVFAANATSSIIQPLFGYFADRISVPWIMPVGVFLAGLGMALAGVAPSYGWIFAAVALSGIGIAAFHPEGARLTNSVSGDRKGAGVSTFSAGGNVGFAVGPLLITAILSVWGMQGTLALIVPVTAISLLLMHQLPKLTRFVRQTEKAAARSQQDTLYDEWGSFTRLTMVVVCRSIIFFGLNTFLPLYWIYVLHQSQAAGSTALTLLLIIGAVSTLVAGRLADRYGYQRIVRIGFMALIPLLMLFVHVGNHYLAAALLLPIGFALFSPFSPMVVLGQKYLPHHMGLASGVTLGLAVSIGGAAAPGLGWVADHYGIQMTLIAIACLPLAAAAISFTLPTPQAGHNPVHVQPCSGSEVS